MATYDQIREDSNPSMDEAKEEEVISNLVAKINSRFQQCETTREDDEDRWLQAFHNYRGRYFKNVTNKESPPWLQQRLKAIGLRPISALVDITNYITYDNTL